MKGLAATIRWLVLASAGWSVCQAAPPFAGNDPRPPLPRGTAESPAYPEVWHAFRQKMEAVHEAFLGHIKDAKQIDVPAAPEEFTWKVDWKAQQAYCRRIADAIFSRPMKAQLAWPDAIAARDGVEHVHEAIGKIFPKCQGPEPTTDQTLRFITLDLPDPLNRSSLRQMHESWKAEKWTGAMLRIGLRMAFFTSESHLIRFSFVGPDDALGGSGESQEFARGMPGVPVSLWSAEYRPDSKTGCPLGRSVEGPGRDPSHEIGSFPFLPTVFLQLDGELLPIEFGTYARQEEVAPLSRKFKYSRWGNRGQKFLLVKSIHHGLDRDWAKSPLPKGFINEPDPDRHRGIHRACVINFE